MPASTVIIITDAHLLLGDTAADVVPGTGTGDAFECQLTQASINANPNLQTVPATFCNAESQAPAATGFELAITWLQDWTVADGLSFYAFTNDTLEKYFSLTLNDSTTPVATGQVRIVAGAYGGEAATPLTADAVWPCVAKPTITPPAATLAAQAAQSEPVPSNA